MNPAVKAFSDSIGGIYIGSAGIFQFFWILAGMSDQVYSNQVSFSLSLVILACFAFCTAITMWSLSKFKLNRLNFKVDKITRIRTSAELSTSIAGFALFGAGIYLRWIFVSAETRIIHPYLGQSVVFFLAGYCLLVLAMIMYHYFLPKQVVEEVSAKPQAAIS